MLYGTAIHLHSLQTLVVLRGCGQSLLEETAADGCTYCVCNGVP